MKILVIEDEPRAAEYLRQGLTESGYAVEVAYSSGVCCLTGSVIAWAHKFKQGDAPRGDMLESVL